MRSNMFQVHKWEVRKRSRVAVVRPAVGMMACVLHIVLCCNVYMKLCSLKYGKMSALTLHALFLNETYASLVI